MSSTFTPITTAEIENFSRIATEVWMDYWPAIIGADQAAYMAQNFLTPKALEKNIDEDGFRYWMIYDGDELVGFTGGYTDIETNRFFIDKVYFMPHARGKGYMHDVLAHYDNLCRTHQLHAQYLHVNKGNELGIRAYMGTGFKNVGPFVADIGGGFSVDDWELERTVPELQD